MLETGVQGEAKRLVTAEMTARAMGSGTLEVLATPVMVALMEETAMRSIAPLLAAGESTVGTSIAVKHLAATPVGMAVRCQSVLTNVDRRSLTFAIEAYDAAGLIGTATHERFVVGSDRFMEKAQAKLRQGMA